MKKSIYNIIFILGLGIVTIIILNGNGSYSIDSNVYTRKQLQDMIVSTALSYYYKNSYTDYEGYWTDNAFSEYSTNYNLSPEMISRSKTMTSQCEAFATTCYMYTFNFDFRKYSASLSRSRYSSYLDSDYNRIFATDSASKYENTYKYFSKVYSVEYLNNIARDIVIGAHSYDTNDPILVLTYQQGRNGIIKGFEGTGLDSITNNNASVTELLNNEVISMNNITSKLLPGDILLNDGHAMVWVGNAIEADGKGGGIHSTGASFNIEENRSGYERFDVRYTTAENIFQKNIRNHGSNPNNDITILRPINVICKSWKRNTVGVDNDDDLCQEIDKAYANVISNNIENKSYNTLARAQLSNLKIEQSVYDSLSENNLATDSSSVNVGDIISYRLRITNKSNMSFCTSGSSTTKSGCLGTGVCSNLLYTKESDCTNNTGTWITGSCSKAKYINQSDCQAGGYTWKSTSGYCSDYRYKTQSSCENGVGNWVSNEWRSRTSNSDKIYNNITIKSKIPDNTKYISSYADSSDKSCNYDDASRTVTCDNINLTANDNNEHLYYYNVRVNNSAVNSISNEGMEIEYNNQKLKMGKIDTFVNFSINKLSGKVLLNQAISDSNNNKSCTNSLSYILSLYDQYFPNNNLSSIITPDNIVSGIFNLNNVPAFSDEPNSSYKYSAYNSYTRKGSLQINELTGNKKKINQILVPYFFGGRKYEILFFNDMAQYKKIYPIWSSSKNFNVGDIIITLKETSAGSNEFVIDNALIYTDVDSNSNEVSYTYCKNNKVIYHSKLSNSDEDYRGYGNGYLLYLLHSSDLYVVLRPSQLYQEQDRATITINKDGSDWDNSGINVSLYQNGVKKYDYSSGFASGPNINFIGVSPGTYNVYASSNSEATGIATLIDTGKTITASSSNVTINYSIIDGGSSAVLVTNEVSNYDPDTQTNNEEDAALNPSDGDDNGSHSDTQTNNENDVASNPSNSNNDNDLTFNPNTGVFYVLVVAIVMIIALFGAYYYFINVKDNNI